MELWAIEYQLLNATPEHVFEWLKSNVVDNCYFDERYQLETSLLSRNEKLIDLGLALYGGTSSVGYELFKSGDSVIRRAALSGRSVQQTSLYDSWVVNNDVIQILLEEVKQSMQSEDRNIASTLMHELLANKFIPDKLLIALYEKSETFSDVDEELWIILVLMTSNNERLSTPYSSTWMNGYAEYEYESVFTAAWRLFKEFPVSSRAARTLSSLSDRLVPTSHGILAFNVIDRWRSDDPKEDEIYSRVRTALVKKMVGEHSEKFKELKNHEDLALRKGYYANLIGAKPDDVIEGFEKDGKDFLDSAIYNDSFYIKEETQSALRQACWDAPDEHHYMDYPNSFKVREKHLSAKHPEWFKDSWSDELPFEEIKDPKERQEKRLEYLNVQVSELHKALLGDKEANEFDKNSIMNDLAELQKVLLGDKDENQEANEFGENSILNDLRLQLQQIGEHIGKLYQKSSFVWIWLVAGVALGFILGRY